MDAVASANTDAVAAPIASSTLVPLSNLIWPLTVKDVPFQTNFSPNENLESCAKKNPVLLLPCVPTPVNNLPESILIPPMEPVFAIIPPCKNTFSVAKPKPGFGFPNT